MCIAIAQAASLALLASAAAAPRPLTSEQTVGTSNQQATSRSRVFGNGTAIVPTLPPSSDTERGTAGPAASAAPPPAPFQLMVNYQRAPALGVGPLLRFSWAVAPPVGISTRSVSKPMNHHPSAPRVPGSPCYTECPVQFMHKREIVRGSEVTSSVACFLLL